MFQSAPSSPRFGVGVVSGFALPRTVGNWRNRRASAAWACCADRNCFEQAGLSGAELGSGSDLLVEQAGRFAAALGKGIDCGLRQA